MPWYDRLLSAINAVAPFLVPTRATNLALPTRSAILKKRTLCLSELAQAYPAPDERRVAAPKKHDLLHRLKRLWRFTDNERGWTRWRPGWLSCPTSSPGWATLVGRAWP